jgi:hypothetical protein
MASNHWFLLVVLGALSCVTVSVQLKQLVETPPASDEAYATLLYGDSFLLGVRVLGQSIRETQTKRYCCDAGSAAGSAASHGGR